MVLPTIGSLRRKVSELISDPLMLHKFFAAYYNWLLNSPELGVRITAPDTFTDLFSSHDAYSAIGQRLIVTPPEDIYLSGKYSTAETLEELKLIYSIGNNQVASLKSFRPCFVCLDAGFDSNVEIIGDTHADLYSSIKAIYHGISQGKENYVVLGDMVDRGVASLENLLFFFLLHISCPQQILLLRGNHEAWAMSRYASVNLPFLGQFKMRQIC